MQYTSAKMSQRHIIPMIIHNKGFNGQDDVHSLMKQINFSLSPGFCYVPDVNRRDRLHHISEDSETNEPEMALETNSST